MPPSFPSTDGHQASWLAPSALTRARVVERGGGLDRVTRINGALSFLVLVACALTRGDVVLIPLVVLMGVITLGPIAINHAARPEYADLTLSVLAFAAVAFGAGMTGGATSPLVYLLPVGIVVEASRGVPLATAASALLAGTVLLGTALLAEGRAVVDDPLPTAAMLAALASITLAGMVLSESEITYRRAAVLDPLTGLLNRQGLEERFEELRQQAVLSDAPICLVLFDLDHFKGINDRYGHDVGDAVLRQVAYEVRKSMRKFELVYRIGGEEFLVILPGVAEEDGTVTAEQLRAVVERARIRAEIGVTASFGVSSDSGEGIAFEALYRRADEALYDAKRGGRDRVGLRPAGAELRREPPRPQDLTRPTRRNRG